MTPLEAISESGQRAARQGIEASRLMTPEQRLESMKRNIEAARRMNAEKPSVPTDQVSSQPGV